MRFVYEKYGINLELSRKNPNVLYVEKSEIFSQLIRNLWMQFQGGDGELLFCNEEKAVNIAKEIEFIVNPFALDCNNKKILSKVYKELEGVITEQLFNDIFAVNSQVISMLDKAMIYSQYSYNYNLDPDIQGLLKLYNIKLNYLNETPEELIVEYIRIMHQVCGIRFFVFLNLKTFFDNQILNKIYEFCEYEEVTVFLLENKYVSALKGEKIWILDKDMCIIEKN